MLTRMCPGVGRDAEVPSQQGGKMLEAALRKINPDKSRSRQLDEDTHALKRDVVVHYRPRWLCESCA